MKTVICTFSKSSNDEGNIELLRNNYLQSICNGFYKYNLNDINDLLYENPLFFEKENLLVRSNIWLPYILLETMKQVNMNDYVIYSNNNLIIKSKLDEIDFKLDTIKVYSDNVFTNAIIPHNIIRYAITLYYMMMYN